MLPQVEDLLSRVRQYEQQSVARVADITRRTIPPAINRAPYSAAAAAADKPGTPVPVRTPVAPATPMPSTPVASIPSSPLVPPPAGTQEDWDDELDRIRQMPMLPGMRTHFLSLV